VSFDLNFKGIERLLSVMTHLRRTAKMCLKVGVWFSDDPDEPAFDEAAQEYAERVQVGLLLFREKINKPLREYEEYLNEMKGILKVFDLEESPDHTSFSKWEKKFSSRKLRRLLDKSAEQAGWSGTGAIDASGFQRDQSSYHYRNRADYSFHKLKTTILVDTESLAIKDVHCTTRNSWDGHIGLQVFRRNAEDLQEFLGDKNYSWSELREECRAESTRPVIKHKEHNGLKQAHNARIDDDLYHQRWMCETVFALLKANGGEKLRAKTWHGQFREMLRKCIVHNLSLAAG
jgi:IS5 family transposase